MTTKHTPGPWKYNPDYPEIISESSWAIEPMPECDIEGCRTRVLDLTGAMGGDNTLADARLIAAAPDLLEALRAFLRAPSVGSDGPGSSTIVVQSFVLQDASDAIAKATGEKMPQYTDRHARAAIAKATD